LSNNIFLDNEDIHVFDPESHLFYLKPCEYKQVQREIDILEAEINNKTMIVADMPMCDPDGNYAPVQSFNNRLLCAHPETGLMLENFNVHKFSHASKTINCSKYT